MLLSSYYNIVVQIEASYGEMSDEWRGKKEDIELQEMSNDNTEQSSFLRDPAKTNIPNASENPNEADGIVNKNASTTDVDNRDNRIYPNIRGETPQQTIGIKDASSV